MSATETRTARSARIKAKFDPCNRGSNTHYALHRRRTSDREPIRVESRKLTLMERVQAELEAARQIDLFLDEDAFFATGLTGTNDDESDDHDEEDRYESIFTARARSGYAYTTAANLTPVPPALRNARYTPTGGFTMS